MPGQRKLLWNLFRSHLIITIISIFSVAFFAAQSLRYFHIMQIHDDLQVRAQLFEKLLTETQSFGDTDKIDRLCKETGSRIVTRITVIQPDGVVTGDSDEDIDRMDNHGDRPEIQTAMTGKIGTSTRYSDTLLKELMYVALPVQRDGEVFCVVRASRPVSSIVSSLRVMYIQIAGVVIVIFFIAVFISFILSRRMNKPISDMMEGALRFAGGDLEYRVSAGDIDEFNALAEGMNTMASQLSERIDTISEQRNEIEAILSGMVEAVIAVDTAGRIVEYNRAAEKMFGIYPGDARNKNIYETVRNTSIQKIIEQILSEEILFEDEIVFHCPGETILNVHGAPLTDPDLGRTGAVLVFNDITHLKKLQNVRRDFVANVSHELKTPIATVIGFLETLKDGAIDDAENRQRFIDIAMKHSRRLNSIVEDLLSLSRLEQLTDKDTIEFEMVDVCSILSAAVALFEKQALNKDIDIKQECEQANLLCSSSLLIQAVGNLIDNAIKYSPEKSLVNVSSQSTDNAVIIKVSDSGAGIPEEHLERIFERFYRIDKGRSRDLGGTGLGLSIVKHIVIAHGGTVSVESFPGSGSMFTITLPHSQK